MEKKWAIWLRYGFVIAAILITFVSVGLFARGIRSEITKQTELTLHDVANQNVITVEKEIRERQNFLYGMSVELQEHTIDEAEDVLKVLRPYVKIYKMKRMGYIHKGGLAYTTDGYVRDLSFRDFYIKGMQGESMITGVMKDTLGVSEDINVFSVPVYQKGNRKASGVLFATYSTGAFENLLNVESFNGKGYSLIVKPDGTIIADSEKSWAFGAANLFKALEKNDNAKNKKEIHKLRTAMQAAKSGNAEFLHAGKRYLYYTPIDNKMEQEQWYMLTVVPGKVLQSRVDSFLHDIWLILITMVVILLLLTIIFSVSYRRDQRALMRIAYIDPLTGGDNYASFADKMKRRGSMDNLEFLVALDLMEFKIINSTCGVKKGDEALQRIWRVVDNNLNRNELAAHINADHFVLYLLSESKEKLEERIEKLTKEIIGISEKIQIPDLVPYYGIYQMQEMEDVETSYNKANQAKHFVKDRRKADYAFYEDVDYNQILEDKRLADGFEEAIENHRFEVWYQPKYSTDEAVPVGAEALVRWREKDGSLIPPYKFIPLFEKNGMIARLDEYVFESVCRQQKSWQREGRQILPVSINISRASLYYSSIVEKYLKIVEEYDVPIEYIQLEITESAMIENAEVKELIERFHDVGFQLLLDDFGNGYSSLATLNTLHFDVLKVDKSLIDYIGNADGEKLLTCIIGLAKSLGLRTTAEGVEFVEQVRFLKALQCNDIQGYYFSKPLPLGEYEMML